jgi:hypothetical protein
MKLNRPRERDPGMTAAIRAAGSMAKLGEALPDKLTAQAVSLWEKVPAERLLQISEITGLPYEVLRPDLFPARRVERDTQVSA